MSISFFRDEIIKRLEARGDAAVNRAIAMRVTHDARADGYALWQVDTLAEARAFGDAINIVIQEYKRLVEQTEVKPDAAGESKTTRESVYG